MLCLDLGALILFVGYRVALCLLLISHISYISRGGRSPETHAHSLAGDSNSRSENSMRLWITTILNPPDPGVL